MIPFSLKTSILEAGLVCRQPISGPGMPWGYWCEEQIRQKLMSKISDTIDVELDGEIIPTEILCRKYIAEKSSDLLTDSIKEFFSNNDIINKEIYKEIIFGGVLWDGNPEEIYLNFFSPKSLSQIENEPKIAINCDKGICRYCRKCRLIAIYVLSGW
jgi:hypothetical protein